MLSSKIFETNKRSHSNPDSSSPDMLRPLLGTNERQGQQPPEIHEASSSTIRPPDNDILRNTFNGQKRSSRAPEHPSSTSPLLHERASIGDFEVVNHSDAEEEFVLVESQPRRSEVNQSPFQKWVEAYESNKVVEYMGKKSWPRRFLQESTMTSLLNEKRLEQYHKDIYADYSKEVDKIREKTGETISKKYKKDIKDIEDSIKACQKKMDELEHIRMGVMQKFLSIGLKEKSFSEKAEIKERSPGEKAEIKEKSPGEKAELLKGKLDVIDKVISGYKEDLGKFRALKKELREMADKEISEISKLKVEGLQKTVLDGFQQHLLLEQKYQDRRRDVMAMFGNIRSVFTARSLFRMN